MNDEGAQLSTGQRRLNEQPVTASGRHASGLGLRHALMVLAMLACAGCAVTLDVGYYWQSARGHWDLMQRARPIAELIGDPATDPALRSRLALAGEIRAFASRELRLPDNGSYTRYADLQRPFVVWNVFAAPELSLQLRQWCFPVAGCVAYRGYFEAAQAEQLARQLRAEGWDVQVSGVPAYSTLGWFDDPLLNTFIRQPDTELARLIFHELAHQVVYVAGDSAFNESFATAVEEVGVARWLDARGNPAMRDQHARQTARRADFLALLQRARERLEGGYRDLAQPDAKRRHKEKVFVQLQQEYQALRQQWGGFAGYDRWFEQPLGNAHLASVATYTVWVPAFRHLLAMQQGDLTRFFDAVRALADLPIDERARKLKALAEPARQ